jgi:glycosyltransferase involved in cell wall biosynthesis
MDVSRRTARVAYLTSLYPAVSHTFILREVESLRELGVEVETCAIRRPDDAHLTGEMERTAAASTFYVLEAARRLGPLAAAQALAFTAPRRYLGTLALALRSGGPGLRALLYQIFYFFEATILAHHLQRRGIGHLHNHFADPSANVAMLAAALAGIPFSYTLHGPAELFEPYRWRLDTKTARARFVLCISHFARSQAMYFSDPEHWPKLRIVHCGIRPELYDGPPIPPASDGTRLLFVGRLTPIKGLRVLFEAFTIARAGRPGLTLTLVGDGDDRRHLEALAAPMGHAVRFLGYRSQEEVAHLLAESDALVLPSFAEGLPVVLMEAMASARAVIATRVAGVPELVEDGVSGFLVPPGDAASLADRIARLADDPDLRGRMGAIGRETVRADFDVRREAARIAALLAGKGGDAPRPELVEAG